MFVKVFYFIIIENVFVAQNFEVENVNILVNEIPISLNLKNRKVSV